MAQRRANLQRFGAAVSPAANTYLHPTLGPYHRLIDVFCAFDFPAGIRVPINLPDAAGPTLPMYNRVLGASFSGSEGRLSGARRASLPPNQGPALVWGGDGARTSFLYFRPSLSCLYVRFRDPALPAIWYSESRPIYERPTFMESLNSLMDEYTQLQTASTFDVDLSVSFFAIYWQLIHSGPRNAETSAAVALLDGGPVEYCTCRAPVSASEAQPPREAPRLPPGEVPSPHITSAALAAPAALAAAGAPGTPGGDPPVGQNSRVSIVVPSSKPAGRPPAQDALTFSASVKPGSYTPHAPHTPHAHVECPQGSQNLQGPQTPQNTQSPQGLRDPRDPRDPQASSVHHNRRVSGLSYTSLPSRASQGSGNFYSMSKQGSTNRHQRFPSQLVHPQGQGGPYARGNGADNGSHPPLTRKALEELGAQPPAELLRRCESLRPPQMEPAEVVGHQGSPVITLTPPVASPAPQNVKAPAQSAWSPFQRASPFHCMACGRLISRYAPLFASLRAQHSVISYHNFCPNGYAADARVSTYYQPDQLRYFPTPLPHAEITLRSIFLDSIHALQRQFLRQQPLPIRVMRKIITSTSRQALGMPPTSASQPAVWAPDAPVPQADVCDSTPPPESSVIRRDAYPLSGFRNRARARRDSPGASEGGVGQKNAAWCDMTPLPQKDLASIRRVYPQCVGRSSLGEAHSAGAQGHRPAQPQSTTTYSLLSTASRSIPDSSSYFSGNTHVEAQVYDINLLEVLLSHYVIQSISDPSFPQLSKKRFKYALRVLPRFPYSKDAVLRFLRWRMAIFEEDLAEAEYILERRSRSSAVLNQTYKSRAALCDACSWPPLLQYLRRVSRSMRGRARKESEQALRDLETARQRVAADDVSSGSRAEAKKPGQARKLAVRPLKKRPKPVAGEPDGGGPSAGGVGEALQGAQVSTRGLGYTHAPARSSQDSGTGPHGNSDHGPQDPWQGDHGGAPSFSGGAGDASWPGQRLEVDIYGFTHYRRFAADDLLSTVALSWEDGRLDLGADLRSDSRVGPRADSSGGRGGDRYSPSSLLLAESTQPGHGGARRAADLRGSLHDRLADVPPERLSLIRDLGAAAVDLDKAVDALEDGARPGAGFDLLSKVPVFVSHQAFDPLFWMLELSNRPIFEESLEPAPDAPEEAEPVPSPAVTQTPAGPSPAAPAPEPRRPAASTGGPARIAERRPGMLKSQVSPTLAASLAAQPAVQTVSYGPGASATGREPSALSGECSASIGITIRRSAVSMSTTHDGSSIQEVADLPRGRAAPVLGRRAGPDTHESLFIGVASRTPAAPAEEPRAETYVEKLEAPIKIFKPNIVDHAYLLRQFLFGKQFNYARNNRIVLFGLVDVGTGIFMTPDERPELETPVRELLDRLGLFHADYEVLRGHRAQ